MRLSLLALAATAALGFATTANAVTVVEDSGNLDAFSFSVNAGTRTITLWETWGPDTLRSVDIKIGDFPIGRQSWKVIKYVTNNTGDTFRFFEHELLNSDKSQSDDEDGLSFAQNGSPPIARISDTFDSVIVDELDYRDYLRFVDGELVNGATARFQFGLTVEWPADNNPFFIRQSGIVPEPATWAMMIAGFGMVGFAMRRRKAGLASVSA